MAIMSATYSVDTFFFLSGLLVCFLGMRQMKKLKGKINVPMMYFSRYIRLTPTYGYCILFSVSIFLVIGDGPFFYFFTERSRQACSGYWWANFLYIDNIYPVDHGDHCFAWGWYLANDMQFYLVSPIFLILLYRKPKAGIAALIIGTLCSVSITAALSYYYGVMTYPEERILFMHMLRRDGIYPDYDPKGDTEASPADMIASDIYHKPWCRVSVYFIGMITGYILYSTDGKIKIKRRYVAVGWILTAALELCLIYGLFRHISHGTYSSMGYAAFYNAMSRPMWSVGLAWVVIACVSGYGGFIDRFLSWKLFIPLGRLTYSAYLMHLLVVDFFFYTPDVDFHFTNMLFGSFSVVLSVISCGFAYVLAMLIEYPCIGILNAVFNKPKSKPPQVNGEKKETTNATFELENGTTPYYHQPTKF